MSISFSELIILLINNSKEIVIIKESIRNMRVKQSIKVNFFI